MSDDASPPTRFVFLHDCGLCVFGRIYTPLVCVFYLDALFFLCSHPLFILYWFKATTMGLSVPVCYCWSLPLSIVHYQLLSVMFCSQSLDHCFTSGDVCALVSPGCWPLQYSFHPFVCLSHLIPFLNLFCSILSALLP
jgi:hypothetical protein